MSGLGLLESYKRVDPTSARLPTVASTPGGPEWGRATVSHECGTLPGMRVPWLLPCLLLAPLLGGCPKTHIHRFTVTPSVACPGDEVLLGWETNGSVLLKATPEVAGLGQKDDSGSERVTVQGPTRFRLEVSRAFSEQEHTEGEVLSPPRDLEYGIVDSGETRPFTCLAGGDGLESSFSLDGSRVSSHVQVGRVVNMNARTLVVEKGGRSETVGEGAGAPGFEGQPAQGLWRLRVPLESGESCEDVLESMGGRLILKLQLSCPR
jgi:hypothetical protein